jgi:hypothetical protein
MNKHYPRQSGNKFPVLPLTITPRSKKNPREYGVSVCSVPHPLLLLQQNKSCQTLKIYRKWSFKNSTIQSPMSCPQFCYPRAPREAGSTLFQPQLHPPIGHYTSAYIRKPADKFDALFFWTTEP